MISKTFIARPKFALVISIVITLAGLISMGLLPVNMYPRNNTATSANIGSLPRCECANS